MSVSAEANGELYLDLLKKCLTRTGFGERYRALVPGGRAGQRLYRPIERALAACGVALVHRVSFDPGRRAEGRDWPADAETMIGLRRLDNIRACVRDVVRNGVGGDLLEAGVWRGGASIFMRALLKVYGDTARVVWVADSFEGLPKPDPARYPIDAGDTLWKEPRLCVSLEEVRANFEAYGLLDDRVRFLRGWFRETLPGAPVERLAVLRLDGDMYESTMDVLRALYPKLAVGGFVIVDDYGALAQCRAAVDDFRRERGIRDAMQAIDWTGVFWQRSA